MKSDLLKTAIQAAEKAGKIQKKYFNTDYKTETKSSEYDLVTQVDIECEKEIKALLKKSFPAHNFIGEEEGNEHVDSEYAWVIDPLDGTNNFASGLPIFCTSIALTKNNESILGVIYDPLRDELFYAEKGRGAFLNDQPIQVSNVATLARSIIITGFYYSRNEEMIQTLDNIKAFLQQGILGIRRLGSAALDLCYVAAGRASGFWEFELNAWDFAAGKIIVEEAGGRVTDQKNNLISSTKKSFIIASNNRIHPLMLKILS